MIQGLLQRGCRRCLCSSPRALIGAKQSPGSLALLISENGQAPKTNRFSLKYGSLSDSASKLRQDGGNSVASSLGGAKDGKNRQCGRNAWPHKDFDKNSHTSGDSSKKSTQSQDQVFGKNPHVSRAFNKDHMLRDKGRNRTMRFENQTGSARTQQALREIILKVKQASPRFQVTLRDENGKLSNVHLLEVTNALDLREEGLKLIDTHSTSGLPMVTKVPAKDMLQAYSDALAAQVEEQLLASGNARAQKVLRNRLLMHRKKSAVKMVNLAWAISSSDLQNQKRKEIEKRIGSGERFTIVLGDKSGRLNINRELEDDAELSAEPEVPVRSSLLSFSEEKYDLELQKRQKVLANVEMILAELRCKKSLSGHLERQIFVDVEPIVQQDKTESKQKKEQLSSKEQRWLARMEKSAESHRKEDVDPDALYQFKIED
ncbi:hypothetical protein METBISCDRAFT_21294 [Metschnikowia bicuspidata]|uniref:Altered inheritance of mitochondria protein 23, mitochondrial n=1 Tax=Metschnikowia bicuspidata TaxID=27322 RepID=A0A4P9ZHH4_9ASCO|nr:hypothetical protein METBISCDRAFT_21294 [Metschnikowia bicuspidata]